VPTTSGPHHLRAPAPPLRMGWRQRDQFRCGCNASLCLEPQEEGPQGAAAHQATKTIRLTTSIGGSMLRRRVAFIVGAPLTALMLTQHGGRPDSSASGSSTNLQGEWLAPLVPVLLWIDLLAPAGGPVVSVQDGQQMGTRRMTPREIEWKIDKAITVMWGRGETGKRGGLKIRFRLAAESRFESGRPHPGAAAGRADGTGSTPA
jgi:hypothetical protein